MMKQDNRPSLGRGCRAAGLLMAASAADAAPVGTKQRSSIRNLIKTAALGALLATGGTAAAHATPVYGVAAINISNLRVSGLSSADGTAISVTLSDMASYPGDTSAGDTGSGNGTQAINITQATSGPGPFPGENTFSQAMLPPDSATPAGTRSDATFSGNPLSNGAGQFVSEGKLAQPNASASTSSQGNAAPTISARSAETITIDFSGSALSAASVGSAGDSATATTSVKLMVRDVTDVSNPFALSLQDNSTGTGTGTTGSPNALNLTASSGDPSRPNTVRSGTSNYSYSATLQAGHDYQILLNTSTAVQLSSAAVAAVPEPASLALLGVGVVGVAVRRRRRAA